MISAGPTTIDRAKSFEYFPGETFQAQLQENSSSYEYLPGHLLDNATGQVCPLKCNSLVKVRKSLNPPHWGRKCFYPTSGRPNSALSGTLEGLLELTQPLSRDLNLTSKDTYYGNKRIPAGVAQVHGGPRTPSRATITNLDYAFVKNAFFC